MEQKFGQGDIVTDGKFRMRIITVIQDEDGSYYYECVPTDFDAFPREVPQDRLQAV